jgi:hypothetical protein
MSKNKLSFSKKGDSDGLNFLSFHMKVAVLGAVLLGLLVLAGKFGWI